MKVTQQHVILHLDMVLWSSSWWISIFHFIKIWFNELNWIMNYTNENNRWCGTKMEHRASHNANRIILHFCSPCWWIWWWFVLSFMRLTGDERWKSQLWWKIGTFEIVVFNKLSWLWFVWDSKATILLWYIWCLTLEVTLNAEKKWDKFYIIEESWGFSTFFVQNCTTHCRIVVLYQRYLMLIITKQTPNITVDFAICI